MVMQGALQGEDREEEHGVTLLASPLISWPIILFTKDQSGDWVTLTLVQMQVLGCSANQDTKLVTHKIKGM